MHTGSTWAGAAKKIKTLAPFLWPKKSALLKLQVIICILLLIIARVINLFVPIYNRLLVNSLVDKPLVFRWDYVLIFVGFKFLQGGGTGGMGVLNNVRSLLWIGVQQYTTREIEIELFRHLHGLSLRWHLSRKTGEVLRVMNRGTDSISNLLNYVLFQIIPTILDIVIAIVFFVSTFSTWYGVIVFTTMALYLVNSLVDKPLVFRWDYVLIFVGFKFLQGGGTGGMGVLNNVRSLLWIGVQQYTTREIEIELFRHLHGLSLRWHLSRKTGEVLRVMNRGTDSISNLLNYVLFQIIPTILDIVIAIVFFVSTFSTWYGVIVFTTMALYLVTSIVVTEWRTKFQRKMNLADNALNTRSIDSLLNFETVKYYGAEEYEIKEYGKAIQTYQVAEYQNSLSLVFLNSLQNLIITGGLLAGSLLCVHEVVNNQTLTVGDYTLFVSYILQLYVPLNWFGTYYRSRVPHPQVAEYQNSLSLVFLNSLQNLIITSRNFRDCARFESWAVRELSDSFSESMDVGQSGAGKSTIIRLLFRFYDVESGDIFIDNQNIKTVSQASLRQAIGVVPQDTVLFNNSIKFNIQYARINASEEEVKEAATSADIHERILSFPDGYDTQVGERGLKLSGGEKQRVAIARTLLKAPQIVLLDEATSALDTKTERNIQSALNRVCASRTTIIVAHRLSTIIHADEILVMHAGEIVERGRHEELLERNGVYASMWIQQNTKQSEPSSDESPPSSTAQ
ncbi:ATP-binding cassette sub-family B member 6, mitochondrial-like [Diaphorina citri]|uniref:ATP-binding cassette sub-family B member 6, mitochondrial-like n=1 Tax=Diaphorina citri TaxID=121845 RepID=A0A1S3D474_DIACI|nr:ATP-binding cassette sub-family B member 6, mitochondrial-like [Diaphorina citri]